MLRELRCLRRPRRGRLRVQLRRAGAARAGRGRRLQRRRPGPRRLGHLAGRQAAGLLPDSRRQRLARSPRSSRRRRAGCWRPRWPSPRRPPTRRSARSFPSYHAFIRARVRTLPPALSCGTGPGPAASRSPASTGLPGLPARAGAAPAAPGLAQGPAGDAGGGVPRLRRGRGPVRPRGGQPVRRPHRRLRLRPGLRPAAADEPGQGRDVPARLAAAQGACSPPAEQDAMPHVLLAWVRWAGVREGRDCRQAIGATLDAVFDAMGTFTRVYRDPASFGLEPRLRGPAAARRRPGGAGPPGVRVPAAAGQLPRHRPGHARPGQPAGPPRSCWRPTTTSHRPGGQRRAPRPARGAGRPAVARRPAGAVGGRAAPARPGRGPARRCCTR